MTGIDFSESMSGDGLEGCKINVQVMDICAKIFIIFMLINGVSSNSIRKEYFL